MSGEGEVSPGVEEQDITAETVHDASPAPGPNVKRCQVRHFVNYTFRHYILWNICVQFIIIN